MRRVVKVISENFDLYSPEKIEEYVEIGGFKGLKNAIEMGREKTIEQIKLSSLKGRGGAAYPTGLKWQQASKVKGEKKIIICNADEGEPGTFKDRSLLQKDPYRVIEGMAIAAYIDKATEGYIYIREEYEYLHSIVKEAINYATEEGYLGSNILGSGMDFTIKVFSGAGAYVCGENSSLIESMEGKSGRPRIKPPRIKDVGLYGHPTIVNNVETFAAAAVILKYGYEEYIKYGTSTCKGTKLISLCGKVNNPGTYEVPFGISLKEIIYDIGGGIKDNKRLKFMQIGGASGPVIPAEMIDMKYSYDELCRTGVPLGSGAILVADEDNKIIDFLESVQKFFLHESCGKCTPCREGNRQLSKIINRFIKNEGSEEDLQKAKSIANTMKYASFCGLGKTASTAFVSAMKHFPGEFYRHMKTEE